MKQNRMLQRFRDGKALKVPEMIALITSLSLPAIAGQISQVVMEYIDAGMVGHLGAEASAAIGLVASSTWLMGSLLSCVALGFSVQMAQFIGANNQKRAQNLFDEGLVIMIGWSILLAVVTTLISGHLPYWLGGSGNAAEQGAEYFRIFAMASPVFGLAFFAGDIMQSTGNFMIAGIVQIIGCFLDVVFNALLIYPERKLELFHMTIRIPGADLGVAGASLGTVLAQTVSMLILMYVLWFRTPLLKRLKGRKFSFRKEDLKRALYIGVPVGIEQTIQMSAQILLTRIISPLGTIAIAANSLAVTAEGLCYMPGFGIQTAASTLVGQGIGAKQEKLVRKLSSLTVYFGMAVMTLTGALMYYFAPWIMQILSSDPEVQALGAAVLRIEAFAEPLFAAEIVANGVFRGAGDTVVPSVIITVSMWFVRLPLAWFLAPRIGLLGVWTAMAIQLSVQGLIFLVRLQYKNRGSLGKYKNYINGSI